MMRVHSLQIAALALALAAGCSSDSAPQKLAGPDGGDSGGTSGSGGAGGGSSAGGSKGSGGSKSGSGGASGGMGTGSAPGAGGASGAGGATGSGGKASNAAFGIAPKSATAAYGGKVQFKATGPETNLSWSVDEGASGGAVTGEGLYTAPSTTGSYHVTVKTSDGSKSDTATVSVTAPEGTPPTLTPGTWTNITPSQLSMSCCPGTGGNTFGSSHLAVDPSNPAVLYITVDQMGMWKSTDRGSTWRKLGDPTKTGANATSYLDSPSRIRVDPSDPQHLYATQGVRGQTQGFWVSRDGGETWTLPPGFVEALKTIGTRDMTTMSVDPTDFDHVLVGSHSAWTGLGNAGVLETTDGGETFAIHQPRPSWNAGSIGISILRSPKSNLGNGSTWLVGTDTDGLWRTTDSGGNWTKVSDIGIPHGGQDIYYTVGGTLYAGGAGYPIRSRDNGATWEQVKEGLPYAYYYTVHGDGKTLYTLLSGTGLSGRDEEPYSVSPETDGTNWTDYKGGAQKFLNGPAEMVFDSTNGILYSANWVVGIWALKVE